MITYEKTKLKESLFFARLRENLLSFEKTGSIQESDNLAQLRKLTDGKLLKSELEAKYPLGKSLSMRLIPKTGMFKKDEPSIILTGKVVVRLERLIETGSDDEPTSLGRLNNILSRETDLASRGCYETFFGLYSPTGWSEEAKAFIANDPPGSGWASNRVCPILIGPEITELVWDKRSEKIKKYIQCFCGLTLEERQQVCKDAINRAIMVQEFASLSKIAAENSFDINFVKAIAEKISSQESNLKLTKIKNVGLVLKRRI